MTTKEQIFSRISPEEWIDNLEPKTTEEEPAKLKEYRRMPDSEKQKLYQKTGKTFAELFNQKPDIKEYLNRKWTIELYNQSNFLAIMDFRELFLEDQDIYDRFTKKAAQFKKVIITTENPFPTSPIDFSQWPELPDTDEDEMCKALNNQ